MIVKDNPGRLGLISSLLTGACCRFYPSNWHTPIDGVVTAVSTVNSNNRFLFNVEISYHSTELIQTVKLMVGFHAETYKQNFCHIV